MITRHTLFMLPKSMRVPSVGLFTATRVFISRKSDRVENNWTARNAIQYRGRFVEN
jgi:hypothetical protein